MKKLLFIFILLPFIGLAQTTNVVGTNVIANQSFTLHGVKVTFIQKDSMLRDSFKIPTSKAVYDFVVGRVGLVPTIYTADGSLPNDRNVNLNNNTIYFKDDDLKDSSNIGLALINSTAATGGDQRQNSPALYFESYARKTSAPAGSRKSTWKIWSAPQPGSGSIAGRLYISNGVNDVYDDAAYFEDLGILNLKNALKFFDASGEIISLGSLVMTIGDGHFLSSITSSGVEKSNFYFGDSIVLKPYDSKFYVDSLLRSISGSDVMVVWDTISQRISYRTIPSGGGGGSQDLQSVTDIGFVTTNGIEADYFKAANLSNPLIFTANGGADYIQIVATAAASGNWVQTLPGKSGTFAMTSDVPTQFNPTSGSGTTIVGTYPNMHYDLGGTLTSSPVFYGASTYGSAFSNHTIFDISDANGDNRFSMSSTGLQQIKLSSGIRATRQSFFTIRPDSIVIEPGLSNLFIDSLSYSSSGADSMITWNSSTHKVAMRAIPASNPPQNLQSVTDIGNATTNEIQFDDGISDYSIIGTTTGLGYFKFRSSTNANNVIFANNLISTDRTYTFPNASGTLALTADLSAYQPLDADLTTIAGLTATTDNFIVSVASAWASRTPAQVRTTLGLVIGTDVEAWDADLDYLAGFTPSANVKSILNAADYAAIKTLMSLVPGTDIQVYDADLTTIAGLTATTDNIIQSVGSAWASRTPAQVTATLSVFGASTKGLVPAAAASPSSTKYLSEDGTFSTPAGGSGLTFAQTSALMIIKY